MSPLASSSTRWPWVRGGLGGAILALSPLTWIVQISGCPAEPLGPRTGLQLALGLDYEPLGIVLMIATVVWFVGAPYLTRHAATMRARFVMHTLGLAVTVFVVLLGLAILLLTLGARRLAPAGWLVIALLVASLTDAATRLVLGVDEWRASRRSAEEST